MGLRGGEKLPEGAEGIEGLGFKVSLFVADLGFRGFCRSFDLEGRVGSRDSVR